MSAARREAMTLAALRSDQARQRLLATLGEVRHRLTPETLAQEVLDSAAQGALETARTLTDGARSRPWTLATLAGAIALCAAWRQIGQTLAGHWRRKHAKAIGGNPPARNRKALPSRKGS